MYVQVLEDFVIPESLNYRTVCGLLTSRKKNSICHVLRDSLSENVPLKDIAKVAKNVLFLKLYALLRRCTGASGLISGETSH